MERYDFLIVGGGVIGSAVARELTMRKAGTVALLEKEPDLAMHTSGRNSGVVHAGFYYDADSLKARFCIEGKKMLKEYCASHAVPIRNSGKVIVAKNEEEVKTLYELEKRGKRNGVRVEIIDEKKLRELEPYAKTNELALYSPETSVVDSVAFSKSLAQDAMRAGAKFFFEAGLVDVSDSVAETTNGEIGFNHLINCAGLHADKIAKLFGVGEQYAIVPFRGEYYRLAYNKSHLVRSNIYPVPDKRNSFLGVHLTMSALGEVIVGPTATPALGRENYSLLGLRGISPRDLFSILYLEARLFLKDEGNFRKVAMMEWKRMMKSNIAAEASDLLSEEISKRDLEKKSAGNRAQLVVKKNAKLVNDFVIEKTDNSTHVLNVVSPGLTSSMSFAKYVVDSL